MLFNYLSFNVQYCVVLYDSISFSEGCKSLGPVLIIYFWFDFCFLFQRTVPPSFEYLTPDDEKIDFNIVEGDRVVLPCNVEGDPRPMITWFVKAPSTLFIALQQI